MAPAHDCFLRVQHTRPGLERWHWQGLPVPRGTHKGHTRWVAATCGTGQEQQTPWHFGTIEPGKRFPVNTKLKMARTHLAGLAGFAEVQPAHVGLPRFLVAM